MTAAPATRLVRVIARLNVGGPAIQAISLARLLEPRGYATTLVRGREDECEGSMDYLAAALGVRPVGIPSLRRDPGSHDLRALAALVRLIRRERPAIVHTHAAKAGTLGRVAAYLARPGRRPIIVHTFHGHSLRGYFSPRTAALYLAIERLLALRSDRLIAVSEEVRDELVALGVAPPERFEVIRLGFDLDPFDVAAAERKARGRALREQLGIPPQARLVTLIARLVPVKRVDRFLAVAVRLLDRPDVHFLILGDGDLRDQLMACGAAQALGERLTWAGFRRDVPDVCFASDVVALTSDNEGTPVSLIEAQAAGTPVVSTRVGGVATVVRDGETGLLADPEDDAGLAAAIGRILDEGELAAGMSLAARSHVREIFTIERLVNDVADLYRRLAEERAARRWRAPWARVPPGAAQ